MIRREEAAAALQIAGWDYPEQVFISGTDSHSQKGLDLPLSLWSPPVSMFACPAPSYMNLVNSLAASYGVV